ncbi:MAG TPA: thiamine pyrophosphate-binding protein [Bryobacteraceae bacterium]|jgi:thiamine pyrophosphate-dependent acetolactate synthase large subunit-like protein
MATDLSKTDLSKKDSSSQNPSKNPKKAPVDRRGFLKGAAAGAAASAAALVVKPALAQQIDDRVVPQKPVPAPQTAPRATTPLPNAATAAKETAPPPLAAVYTTDRPGADFMVDVLKSLGFEYVAANPGSSFRGIHESLINYGKNSMPELITCMHEESSAAMAHGYAKIEGKPMMIMAHGTVGLQHASMAIYNAYADRVPMYVLLGNVLDEGWRRGDVEWAHSVQDAASMVRDYTKWDDAPVSLSHFAESAVRAYKISMTPPMEPVVIVADAVLQEEPIAADERPRLRIPKLTLSSPPAGDSGAIAEAAKMLVAAENPVIIAGRAARTPNGIKLLVELADTLQAPVNDRRFRMNFPSKHPLYNAGNVAEADVILGLEVPDMWGMTHSQTPVNRMGMEVRNTTKAGAKIITIFSGDLYSKSNYQDFGRYAETDLAIAADAEATLPALIEACKKLLTGDRKAAMQARAAKLSEAAKKARDRDLEAATFAWDASPISTARVSAELWNLVKNEDWSLVSDTTFFSDWPHKLWDFDKYSQYIGGHGAYGVGYGAPAAVGAALANKKHGRLSLNIQCDGDLNYAPGVLWTATHHQIPLLNIMHNNRAYHQELMYVQDMANRAQRGVERAHIGTEITNPNIDYATMAKAYGMYSLGPISDPKDLAPALKKAIEVVKKGEPAMIDVLTQPR